MMQKRTLLNHPVSLLGFGAMRLPLDESGKIHTEAAQKMVDTAFDAGVNYFDTSSLYHNGESEVFLGKALAKYPRDSYFFTNKMPIWVVKNKEEMEQYFENQLKNSSMEYFDFYLMHNINAENWSQFKELDCFGFLQRMQQQGKVQHIGFSFHDGPALLEEVVRTYPFAFAQLQYNYLDAELQEADKMLDILNANHIPCVVMEPVRGGFLATIPPHLCQPLHDCLPNASCASWALRWVAEHPTVAVILSGMSNVQQLQDNLSTFSPFVPFTGAQKQALASTKASLLSLNNIPCTACRYCMDCPQGVDIPQMLHILGTYKIFERASHLKEAYASAQASNADLCTNCGVCVSKCPQHIQIPDRMQELKALHQSLT